MDSISGQNLEQGQFQPSDSLASAPPPPPEVKIRTMRSDVESMAKTGGGLPQFQDIKVSGLSAEQPTSSAVVRTESKANVLLIAVLIVIVAALIVVGWFAYEKYFANASAPSAQAPVASSTPQAPSNTIAVPTTTPITVPSTPGTSFTHTSFFKTVADQTLTWSLVASGTAQNATQFQTYNQRLLALLATAKKSAALLEIDATDASGNAASINELLAAANAPVVRAQVLAANFNPDATFFAYRDASGFWPGYVIALNPTQNWLAVQSGIQQIESSTAISNLFLMNVGTPSQDGFVDSTVASSSVRVLPFFGGSVPGYFVYGWTADHQYLILSTSQNGYAAAESRL